MIKKNHFDLVVSDLIMLETDGLEVYQILHQLLPNTKFILLTAFIDSERAKLAQKILKESFYEKSIGHEELVQSIINML